MTYGPRQTAAHVLAACALFIVSYPPFDIPGSGLVATCPLALLLIERPIAARAAALAGAAFGLLASLGIVGHWMFLATHEFFGRSVSTSALFTVFVNATNVALFYIPVFLIARSLAGRSTAVRIFGFAAVWTAGEYLRAYAGFGNPWALLGHTLHHTSAIAQSQGVGGVWILSWAAAATGAALAAAISARRARHSTLPALGTALATLLGVALAGVAVGKSSSVAEKPRAPLRIGIVQADIGKHDLWRPDLAWRHLEVHLELSRDRALAGADLIVWPENAVPFLLEARADALDLIHGLADDTGAAIVLGAPRVAQTGDGRASRYVSAYLVRPGSRERESYDKVKLLPFVEKTPGWARWWDGLTWDASYTAGTDLGMFEVKGWRVAPLICFEGVYPLYAARAARAGADVFLNISNDSWFDGGAGPEQHFMMARPRAAEHGIALVRAANSGISGYIDPLGRTVAQLPSRQQAVRLVEVARPTGPTPYTRFGDVFVYLVSATGMLLAFATRGRSTERERPI